LGTEWLSHRGSVDKPQDGFQMKVVDDEGNSPPNGEIGEIFLLPDAGQGATIFFIGAEAKAFEGGWEYLGD